MDKPKEEEAIPQIKPENSLPESPPSFPEKPRFRINLPKGRGVKILAGIGIGLVLLLGAFIVPAYTIYGKAIKVKAAAEKLVEAGKGQNIDAIKTELGSTKASLTELSRSFRLIAWAKFVPFLGLYVSDADFTIKAGGYGLEAAEITLVTIEPYADILGFTGGKVQGAESDGAKTAQERIDFLIQAIPDLIPKADEISQKITLARQELANIDPNRYPVKFRGQEVREKIRRGLAQVDEAATLVSAAKPLLEVSPYLLGIDEERRYLVLFQNDKELRPTGGFITAYSVMKVDKAKFEPVSSNDIYNLDDNYRPSLTVPDPIAAYIKGPYTLSKGWRLRDMNWSPDFAESMALFSQEAAKAGIKGVDGVIAVDTHLLVNLLDAIGEIGVPGFGNFSTKIVPECDCPQVIYELESFADTEGPVVWDPAGTGKIIYAPPNYDNRKKIIGPLMNSILANAMGQPKEKLPNLFEAAFKSVIEKHVLFYLFDETAQSAVEDFNIAGRIKDYSGDFLHINDSNLGGRKSNLYVTQEVEQEITAGKDGTIEKTVTITYKNPMKHDGWLNSVLPNWVRIYVPKGSELIEFTGVEAKEEPYEQFGKTVFAGFFQLRPEGIAKVTVKYKLPFKEKEALALFIQKQPGTDSPLYRIRVGKREEEEFLKSDKEFRLRI
ncbi:MAG: hypothetical protein UW61_C0015G0007 [Candidatus Curtissbacteria bacterium GW2011_GWC1_44_33]|uniref:DUF4012 domain-containing protein n=1 Tax=Candidatus Curtissbacteria bacterium GW2011_GWC1_44_33 TaxID=1618413 RepID=A0A0G1M576_9BACT|nr:MAG: hypothetical protein UW61_C0015G0007 [Candidatus Curtissbacteria bacterium GW2011_GWC1_44_33]